MAAQDYFYKLDEAEQIELLWESGKHLGERFDGDLTYTVYRVLDFYVEVKYNNQLNCIQGFYAFTDSSHLIPYNDNLNLPDT